MQSPQATEFAGKHEERYTTAARFVTEFFDDPFVRMQQNFLSQCVLSQPRSRCRGFSRGAAVSGESARGLGGVAA